MTSAHCPVNGTIVCHHSPVSISPRNVDYSSLSCVNCQEMDFDATGYITRAQKRMYFAEKREARSTRSAQ